eukprot:COSAG06_NODE_10463_length_1678_cov_1.686510_1_plen_80_part_10
MQPARARAPYIYICQYVDRRELTLDLYSSTPSNAQKVPPGAVEADETFDYTVPADKDTDSATVASFMRNKGAQCFDGFDS